MWYVRLSRNRNFPFANIIAELSRTPKCTCNVRFYINPIKGPLDRCSHVFCDDCSLPVALNGITGCSPASNRDLGPSQELVFCAISVRIALLHLCGLHVTAASCELGWAWGGARLSRRPLWNWYFILQQPARPSHCLCHALSTIHRVAFNSTQHGATGSDPCAGFPFLNRAQITSRTHVLPWLAEMKEQAVETSLILVGDADLNGIHSIALGRNCHCADSGLGVHGACNGHKAQGSRPGTNPQAPGPSAMQLLRCHLKERDISLYQNAFRALRQKNPAAGSRDSAVAKRLSHGSSPLTCGETRLHNRVQVLFRHNALGTF